MRVLRSLIFATIWLSGALAACGGDESSGSGTTASSSSGQGGSTASSTSGTGGSTSSGQGGAPEFTPANGCDPATAENLQEQGVEIAFPVGGLKYDPPCILIHATHSVNFKAAGSTFVSHPLVGGTVVDGVATPDPNSPIGTQDTGDIFTATFPEPGQYPYYCDFHYSSGMMGVVYVLPAPPM